MSISGLFARISPFSLTGRIIRMPLLLVPRGAVVRVLSGINRGMRWFAGAAETNSCWIGNYELDHVAAMQQMVRPGMIAYDIGANVGFYTLALSRLVGDSGHVYSFEPEAQNAHFLRRHVQMNGLSNVTIIQVAVSDASGMVGFRAARSQGKVSSESSYWVPSISLDQFIAAGNPAPSFIKMDIEGAEHTALCGASSVLSGGQTTWMLATHSDELRTSCREIMSRYGYRFKDFDSASDSATAADFLAIPSFSKTPLNITNTAAREFPQDEV